MTDDLTTVDDDPEPEYDYPERRDVGDRSFLEGRVVAFRMTKTAVGDYYEYGEHYVSADLVDALLEHEDHAIVQIELAEDEPNDEVDLNE